MTSHIVMKDLLFAAWKNSWQRRIGQFEMLRYFVSMDGNDGWSGRLAEPNSSGDDGPFASLRRAQLAVREFFLMIQIREYMQWQ